MTAEQAHQAEVNTELELQDTQEHYEVLETKLIHQGKIFDIIGDTVRLGDTNDIVYREYMTHKGAVAILAMNENGEIAMIKQYRHPIGFTEWEIPAGILDVNGETALDGAKRELMEEMDLIADKWNVLVDYLSSPGCTSEAMRVYLARNLTQTATKFDRHDEEATMEVRWIPIHQAIQAVMNGQIQSPSAVAGLMTLGNHIWQSGGDFNNLNEENLRPANSPWLHRPNAV